MALVVLVCQQVKTGLEFVSLIFKYQIRISGPINITTVSVCHKDQWQVPHLKAEKCPHKALRGIALLSCNFAR